VSLDDQLGFLLRDPGDPPHGLLDRVGVLLPPAPDPVVLVRVELRQDLFVLSI
jgi:hypothetical protein